MLFLCFTLFSLLSQAQDRPFLNPNQSLIYLNPSFAGSNGTFRTQALQQIMWPKLSGRNVAYFIGMDAKLASIRSGIALSYVHDISLLDVYTGDYLSLSYAYYFKLFQSKLEFVPSLQGTFGQVNMNLEKVNFHWDPSFIPQWPHYPPQTTKVYADFNAGFLLRYKGWYLGATAFHVNQPDVGLFGTQRLPLRYSIHSSCNLSFSQNLRLNLLLRFNLQNEQKYIYMQAKPNNGMVQANLLLYRHFILGTGYDSQYYFLMNVGYRTNLFTFSLMYANDYFIKEYGIFDAWELNLSYQLRPKALRGEIPNFEAW